MVEKMGIMKLGDYIKFIDDGTLAKNTAKLLQMEENGIINHTGMRKILQIILGRYWDKAVRG